MQAQDALHITSASILRQATDCNTNFHKASLMVYFPKGCRFKVRKAASYLQDDRRT